MVAATKEFQTVFDIMQERSVGFDELERTTGICRGIIEAIAHQRYTPSPLQRERISHALRFPQHKIIWGHVTAAEEYVYSRL
jgi:hypothetical protein